MARPRRARGTRALVATALCALLASSAVVASATLVAGHAPSDATVAAPATGTPLQTETGTPPQTEAGTPRRTATAGTSTPDASPGFSVPAVTRVPRNGRVRIPVGVGNATEAMLVVGGPAFNYEVAARLADADGDGRVDVWFEAAAAGDPDEETLVAAAGADDVTGTGEETTLRGPIEPADYAVALVGEDDADGPVRATGTLVVDDARRDPGRSDRDERPARPPGGFGVDGSGSAWPRGAVPLDALGSLAIGVGLALVALGALSAPGRYD